jgi:DNA replication protein DnaC
MLEQSPQSGSNTWSRLTGVVRPQQLQAASCKRRLKSVARNGVREEHQLMRMKSQLAKLDVLILDELGYVPASKLGSELLFDVISTAYERTSVIVTTNLPFEQWTEVLGSERLTGAVLDRLTHRCHILEASGESYRLKDARRRSPGKRAAEIPAKPPEKDQSTPTN